jgi:tetratricopeptide (TPR) repeat protein
LDEFEALAEKDNRVCQQFLLLHRTMFDDDLSAGERAERCLCAIKLTRPSFNLKSLPRMLSYEEIVCVNNYACYQAEAGKPEDAIEPLSGLRRLYDQNEINPEEALRTRLMVLYNLSKFLGMAGRYEDCIAVCDEGIRISRETSRCSHLDRLLYNKAWSLLKRGGEEDRAEAKECIRLAICSAEALNKKAYLQHYRNYMQVECCR